MSRPTRTGPTAVRNFQRDAQILELKAQGWTHEEIGNHLGLHHTTIGRIIDARLKAAKPEQTELYRQAVWLEWQGMKASAYDQAYGKHYKRDDRGQEILVPAKDEDGEILRDAGGNPIMTRIPDFTVNNSGMAVIAKSLTEVTKLLGLAAPIRTSTTFEQTPDAEPVVFTVRDGGSRHPVFARLTQPELDAVLKFIADNGYGTAPEKTTMKALPMVTHTISVSQPPGTTYEG